jgi:hypothetical protein
MVLVRTSQVLALAALLITTPAFATRTHRAATSGHVSHHKSKKHHFVPGQREIEPERAKEIQDALIREHYLAAPASGQWDATTEAAMQKFQADHGWQTKLTPDSRALIKLGLGPQVDASKTVAAQDTAASPSAAPASGGSDSSHAAAGTLAAVSTIHN